MLSPRVAVLRDPSFASAMQHLVRSAAHLFPPNDKKEGKDETIGGKRQRGQALPPGLTDYYASGTVNTTESTPSSLDR